MFKALNDANKVARKFSDELGLVSVSHSEEDLVRVLTKTAKAMRGPARRLERLSAKYLKSVHALHESYKAVLARPGARVVFPKAIASLRKRQVAGYNVPQQLPDDIAAFKHERDALNSLRGHTSLMTRECDRYIAALEKMIEGSEEFLLLCHKADFISTNAKALVDLNNRQSDSGAREIVPCVK